MVPPRMAVLESSQVSIRTSRHGTQLNFDSCATCCSTLLTVEMTATWTDAETLKLIEQWGEQGIQEQLEGSKRNKHVYEKLSSALAKEGVIKSGEQCRTKVKKLRQDYKKIKDNHSYTGRGRTSWKFFEPLNDFLGTRLATRPPVVLDTQDATSLVAEENDEISDEEEDVVKSGSSAVTNEDSMLMENSEVEVTGTKSGSSSRSTTPARSSTAIKRKKRKRSKGEVMKEVLSNVMKTVTGL